MDSWEDKKALITELTQGMECAKQLRSYLHSQPSHSSVSSDTHRFLLDKIETSFQILLCLLHPPPSTTAPESSISVEGSSPNEGIHKSMPEFRSMTKRRKLLPTWTEQVRVVTDNGLEGPPEDGYSWRKYGQKDILGAKYPRSYYRCTYRQMHNCWAIKQVQRSDGDSSLFEITYKGAHTCRQVPPKKKELEQNSYHHNDSLSMQPTSQMLTEFRSNLRVDTNDFEGKETLSAFSFPQTFPGGLTDENQQQFQISQYDLGTYSPSFASPTTSESNIFGAVQNFHCSESIIESPDLNDIFSATTSSTNSPNVGLDYTLDLENCDPNFLFDASEFFQ
ncbi:unnamed protein product [Cuscuta epithymum]|uniref:WRKY domain-containing protein n=1 Tax=Cuscuta epithymum TaxID=186058 RepID=A0AAV0D047_9ASTE|nr:unnamed protein product [Cuscuta epithymum]